MLVGKYPHFIDSKNRLVIPSRLMDELRGTLYIYPALSVSCIKIFNEESWKAELEKIFSDLPREMEYKVRQSILPRSQNVLPDNQNRIQLTPTILSEAQISEKEVYILGMGDYCEVWSRTLHDAEQKNFADDETIDRIRQFGF